MGPLATSLAVLLAGASTASGAVFSLKETYDSTNFFDKFDFFESRFDTGTREDQDPSHGFVNYKSREAAFASGLAKYDGKEMYLGVDSKNTWWDPDGRPSVRLESKNEYTKGLFIARFSHLPKLACGAWPAFWMYSNTGGWPNGGEIDILENWNIDTKNHPTFHTGNSSVVGACSVNKAGMTGTPMREDCSHDPTNSGCNVIDNTGPWGTPDGGVFAMEWTDSYIRIFSWSHANVPSNIDSKQPDTSKWGLPVTEVSSGCDIKRQFAPQRMVLNIDFCGDAAGNPWLWNQQCLAATGEKECYEYVRKNPSAYKDVYYKVQDIRYFEETTPKPSPSSNSTSLASSTSRIASTSSTAISTGNATTTTTSKLASSSSSSSSVLSWSNSTVTSGSSTRPILPGSAFSSVTSSSAPASSGRASPGAPGSSGRASSSAAVTTSAPVLSDPEATPVQEWTTSTVYTTATYTITSCPPTVTDCPARGTVVTETISLYETVCLVTPTAAPKATSSALIGGKVIGDDRPLVTSTTKVTHVYTITSCPPVVTDCPVGKVTSEVVTSTVICPEGETNIGQPGNNIGQPGNNIGKPGDNTGNAGNAGNTGNTGKPGDSTSHPSDNTGRPGNSYPGDNASRPGNSYPGDNTGHPGNSHPGDNAGRPADSHPGDSHPGDNTGRPGNTGSTGGNTGNAGDNSANPIGNTGNTGSTGDNIAKPIGNTGNTGNTGKPGDSTGDNAGKPGDNAGKPADNSGKPADNAGKPADKPSGLQQQPAPAPASSFDLSAPTGNANNKPGSVIELTMPTASGGSSAPSGRPIGGGPGSGSGSGSGVPVVTGQAATGKAVSTLALAMGVLAAALFL